MNLTLGESPTSYHGKKEKVAVVGLGGNQVVLGLADTVRCARSVEAAERMVVSLARRFGITGVEANGAANRLHQHCRKLSGMKTDEPEE